MLKHCSLIQCDNIAFTRFIEIWIDMINKRFYFVRFINDLNDKRNFL